MKLMNGTYYEITGGLEEDIITKKLTEKKATEIAADTERVAYKNTYVNGKRTESVRLYDPHGDGFYTVGSDTEHYEPLPRELVFEYQMLGRLRSDCEYFLGYGNGYEPHLWAGSVEKQIEEMRKRLNGFKADEKPEWLTMEDIDCYEREMLAKRRTAKVDILVKILEALENDEWFRPRVIGPCHEYIYLDEGAIRELIKYYGG